jgi:hypothetical protein
MASLASLQGEVKTEAKDDYRYKLTEIEQLWVTTIKKAINDNDLENFRKKNVAPYDISHIMTEFMWAQLAIVTKGKPRKAILRMKKMREIWKEYKLDDYTEQEGYDWYEEKMPGFVSASRNDNAGHPVICCDYSQFLPDNIDSERDWGLMFYLLIMWMNALQTNFDEMRSGSVWLFQCENMGWKNFCLEMEKKGAEIVQDAYPIKFKSCIMLNGGFMINTIIGLCKFFLKKKLAARIRTGTENDLIKESPSKAHATKNSVVLEDGFHGCCEFSSLDKIPPILKGNYIKDSMEWIQERLEVRRANAKNFNILSTEENVSKQEKEKFDSCPVESNN